MTGQVRSQFDCPRCGAQLPAYAQYCHRCDLRIEPGVAYFEPRTEGVHRGPVTPTETGWKSSAVTFERKAITCLPMDLERIARTEAVDGWALLDTTVDPDVPGNILAHFRRPARQSAPSTDAGGAEYSTHATGAVPDADKMRGAPIPVGAGPPKSEPRPSTSTTRQEEAGEKTKSKRESTKRRRTARAPVGHPLSASSRRMNDDTRNLIFILCIVIGMLMLVRLMGPIGFFVALFVLPGLLRSVLGVPKRKRRRRRRR